MPRFEFDPTVSLMSVDGRSTLHPIHAEAAGLTGWIEADIALDTGQAAVHAGRFEIPLVGLSSGNVLYDAELRRRLDIRRYPEAAGVVSDWQPTSHPGAYRVKGDVTFRGVTRSVEDDMSLSKEDERTVILSGTRIFDIRQFGMNPPRLLAVRVYPEVTISIALVGRLVE
jgi:polyisoprenoid-binding protein YceI